MPAAPAAGTSSSTGGLSDNTAGALAYVTFIPALIFLLLEPYNRRRFVRFHAFQSLLFNLAYFVIHIGLRLLPSIGWALSSLVWFLAFVLWIVFVVKASQGQLWKAPIIGDIAEKQAGA
jgi:uncharacterized membrane protein